MPESLSEVISEIKGDTFDIVSLKQSGILEQFFRTIFGNSVAESSLNEKRIDLALLAKKGRRAPS